MILKEFRDPKSVCVTPAAVSPAPPGPRGGLSAVLPLNRRPGPWPWFRLRIRDRRDRRPGWTETPASALGSVDLGGIAHVHCPRPFCRRLAPSRRNSSNFHRRRESCAVFLRGQTQHPGGCPREPRFPEGTSRANPPLPVLRARVWRRSPHAGRALCDQCALLRCRVVPGRKGRFHVTTQPCSCTLRSTLGGGAHG